jgi:signal peptidase
MNVTSIKNLFLKFWRSEDEKVSFVRDIFVAIFVVVLILSILWTYTGQWFGAPMVAIESGSMMHLNEPFGRVGTIDAGDMVLLVKIDRFEDIVTRESEKEKGAQGFTSYGDYGDVVVYRKYGLMDAEQIIHRAMCWVEVNSDGSYIVDAYNIQNASSITIPELGLSNYQPTHSGYITKGDNPITNDRCDQAGGICSEPIKLDWITGKARGEIPWVGTLNLFFNDILRGSFWNGQEQPTVYNVQSDCIICLVILISILILIPISFDLIEYSKKRDKSKLV